MSPSHISYILQCVCACVCVCVAVYVCMCVCVRACASSALVLAGDSGVALDHNRRQVQLLLELVTVVELDGLERLVAEVDPVDIQEQQRRRLLDAQRPEIDGGND